MRKELLLASTSPYRRALMTRLDIPFSAQAPLFDEESAKQHAPQDPQERALFLARGKAQSLAAPGRIVIGSDQLLHLDGQILGKPKTHERALQQLQMLAGKKHDLVTAVSVWNDEKPAQEWVEVVRLKMKPLTQAQIERLIELDQPFDCAGSYKIEKSGIALFDQIEAHDFSAIEGLPLLHLLKVLETLGLRPFSGGL